jgi:DeoR family suf operon transcriptional repressor
MAEPSTGSLSGVPAPRRRLLVALKRRGEASVEDLASALGVTVSAVRQQLAGLRADGLVTHRTRPNGAGRPRHLHSLTAAAEAFFPRTYADLTNELLAYVEDEDPGTVDRVFERRRRRRVEDAAARMAGRSFRARVEELTRILDEDGYLANVETLPGGAYLVTEHNCAILGVAERYGLACSTEIEFLRQALPDANVERVAHRMAGALVCSYEIRRKRPRARPRRNGPKVRAG